MSFCATHFKKRESRLTTLDYIIIRNTDTKLVGDVKVKLIGGQECSQQHKLLLCNILVKESRVKSSVHPQKNSVETEGTTFK